MYFKPIFTALMITMTTAGLASADVGDRFWVLWEQVTQEGANCPGNPACIERRDYSSRLFTPENMQQMHRLFGMLDGSVMDQGRLDPDPEAPRICQHNAAEIGLGFDPERLALTDKIEVLRDLDRIALDISTMKAPPGHAEGFGKTLQNEAVRRLKVAGIKVVDKESLSQVPGQPQLNIYFSHTGGNSECQYTFSVFASLSQTVLLTRDLKVKISASVWSHSTNSARFAPGREDIAILSVIEKLIQDYSSVNSRFQ